MGEDELVWKSGQAPMLRGSGSSVDGEGENALFSIPPHPQQQPSHQHFFFNDHEIASWPHHHIFYTQPQSSVSLATPASVPYDPPRERITGQFFATEENLSNLRGNIITGAGPWISVVRESTQVGSSSAIEYPLVPVMESTEIRLRVTSVVSQTFVVPSLDRKEKTVVIETKAETDQIEIQPAMETTDETKRKEREGTEETEEAPASTSSRKRSRAAEMHNLSARRRREKINDSMKDLQELIPRCNKSDKASMLEDAVQYMKSLQMQIQMISTGSRMMRPRNMQPHMAMGMNRPPFIPLPGTPPPFPSQSHMAGLGPAYPPPHYPFPAYDPSRIHIPPSQQPNPVWNQPQFPGYMNPYSQFVGLQQQIQQPPPLQNQPIPQLSLGQASSSKEPEDQENQPRDE